MRRYRVIGEASRDQRRACPRGARQRIDFILVGSPQRLEKQRSEPLPVIGAQRGECLDEAGIVPVDDH